MTPGPDVRVLSTVTVAAPDGAPRAPRGPRAAALVVLLALAAGRPVSTSSLVAQLWDDAAPADPRAALQNLVSRLRRAARPGLVVSSEAGYALAGTSDLALARTALRAARDLLAAGDPAAAAERAAGGLDLLADDPAPELRGSGFEPLADELGAAATRLRDGLRTARRDAAEAAGDHGLVVRLATADLEADPTDEDAARALMAAQAAAG